MASPEVDYGKFSSLSTPYQLWEPDAQATLETYADIYLNGSIHSPGGFHFAINVDPSMFEVYLASKTGTRAWNEFLNETNSLVYPRMLQTDSGLLITSRSDTDFVVLAIDTDIDNLFSSIKYTLEPTILPDGGLSSEGQYSLISDASTFSLIDEDGMFAKYQITEGSVSLVDSGVLGSTPDAARVNTLSVFSNGTTLFELFTTTGYEPECSLILQVLDSPLSTDPMASSWCFQPEFDVHSGAAFVSSAGEPLVLISDGSYIYGSTLSSDTFWQVDAGQYPSISENGGVLAAVWGGSYCFNSHKHNTRASPRMCDTIPTPTDWTLSYTVGQVDAWMNHFSQSSVSLLNVCNENLLHGSWALGSRPDVAVLEGG